MQKIDNDSIADYVLKRRNDDTKSNNYAEKVKNMLQNEQLAFKKDDWHLRRFSVLHNSQCI